MQTLTVDRGDLGELCSQGFSFPIESAVRQLMITITVSAGSPRITLLDDNSKELFQSLLKIVNFKALLLIHKEQ